MFDPLTSWRPRLLAAKQAAKDRGDIKGDADLAVRVSELLEPLGLPKVDRGAVNHWITGRNFPSLAQFVALCSVLAIDPADALSSQPRMAAAKNTHSTGPMVDEVALFMAETTDRGRAEIAMFARQTAERYPQPKKSPHLG